MMSSISLSNDCKQLSEKWSLMISRPPWLQHLFLPPLHLQDSISTNGTQGFVWLSAFSVTVPGSQDPCLFQTLLLDGIRMSSLPSAYTEVIMWWSIRLQDTVTLSSSHMMSVIISSVSDGPPADCTKLTVLYKSASSNLTDQPLLEHHFLHRYIFLNN